MIFVLLVFIVLALFDAVFGGAVLGVLQIGGWSTADQSVNDTYQLLYGFVVLLGSVFVWRFSRTFLPVVSILILFLGYVEDVLFYLLQPVVAPLIRSITEGVSFQVPSSGLFPIQISGWIGWVSRLVMGENISIPIEWVFVLNGIAVLFFSLLMRRRV